MHGVWGLGMKHGIWGLGMRHGVWDPGVRLGGNKGYCTCISVRLHKSFV